MFQILHKLHKDKSSQTSHGGETRPMGHLVKEGELIFIDGAQVFSKFKKLIENRNDKFVVI